MVETEEKPRTRRTRKPKTQVSKPFPPEFLEMINTPPANWFPTHTLYGEHVMRVVSRNPNLNINMPVTRFWSKDLKLVNFKPRLKERPVTLELNDIYGKPVDSNEAAYMRGYEAGKKDLAEEQALKEAGENLRSLKEFKTRDLSTVFMATMGAHEGDSFILSVDGSESQFQYRDHEGFYIVTGRFYDWRTKTHAVHKIRIPETMVFEVVE